MNDDRRKADTGATGTCDTTSAGGRKLDPWEVEARSRFGAEDRAAMDEADAAEAAEDAADKAAEAALRKMMLAVQRGALPDWLVSEELIIFLLPHPAKRRVLLLRKLAMWLNLTVTPPKELKRLLQELAARVRTREEERAEARRRDKEQAEAEPFRAWIKARKADAQARLQGLADDPRFRLPPGLLDRMMATALAGPGYGVPGLVQLPLATEGDDPQLKALLRQLEVDGFLGGKALGMSGELNDLRMTALPCLFLATLFLPGRADESPGHAVKHLLVLFMDQQGMPQLQAVRASNPLEFFGNLANAGVAVLGGQAQRQRWTQLGAEIRPKHILRVVEQAGHHNIDGVTHFVLPNGVDVREGDIGLADTADAQLLLWGPAEKGGLRRSRDAALDKAKGVLAACRLLHGTPIFAGALAGMLLAPLIRGRDGLEDAARGGWCLYGASGVGKSAVLTVVAALNGPPGEFRLPLAGSKAGFNARFLTYNDMQHVLDDEGAGGGAGGGGHDLAGVSGVPELTAAIAHVLGDGSLPPKATRSGGMRPGAPVGIPVIMARHDPLRLSLRAQGPSQSNMANSIERRVCDVPAVLVPGGKAIRPLPDGTTPGKAEVDALQEVCRKAAGAPLQAWVQHVAAAEGGFAGMARRVRELAGGLQAGDAAALARVAGVTAVPVEQIRGLCHSLWVIGERVERDLSLQHLERTVGRVWLGLAALTMAGRAGLLSGADTFRVQQLLVQLCQEGIGERQVGQEGFGGTVEDDGIATLYEDLITGLHVAGSFDKPWRPGDGAAAAATLPPVAEDDDGAGTAGGGAAGAGGAAAAVRAKGRHPAHLNELAGREGGHEVQFIGAFVELPEVASRGGKPAEGSRNEAGLFVLLDPARLEAWNLRRRKARERYLPSVPAVIRRLREHGLLRVEGGRRRKRLTWRWQQAGTGWVGKRVYAVAAEALRDLCQSDGADEDDDAPPVF